MTQTLKTLIPLAVVFAFLIATNFIYAAWSAPDGTPSAANNAPAPINVSSSPQSKSGLLGLSSLLVSGATTMGTAVVSPGLLLDVEGKIGATQYCDENGANCFDPVVVGGMLPTCAQGQTLVADATGTWVCGSQSASAPTTAWLVNNQHSESQCESLGGVVTTSASGSFCRFTAASCPTGWARYNSWTRTSARSCYGSGGATPCKSSCTTGSHGWSNTGLESCNYENYVQEKSSGECVTSWATCPANVLENGCY